MFIPQLRPDQISRPQLLEYLDQGLRKSRSLTLISAPAGYGKSTIVVAWIHERQLAAAWLTVDDGDNEPALFFAYLAAALEKQFPEAASKLADRLKAPRQPSPIALMTVLINDISQASGTIVDARRILVLDNYQAISEAALHESIDFLLEHLPPQLHLVIITRQDPPLALSRLRGRGLISEIRQDNLRFGKEEVGRFLLQTMAIKPSENEIAVLSSRTEGWITGLQLAALSMRGLSQKEKERFLAAFSGRHHFILDYLTDEVLRRQQRSIQEFLLCTSILEHLNEQLCDALFQGLQNGAQPSAFSNSQSRLEYLESSNLFLVPLDAERRWYRYHQLFAQLLQARLMESHPDLVPVLHQNAAAWYEANGYMAEAVGHALASGDMEATAELIGRALKTFATWSQVEVKTFLAWLRSLPDSVLNEKPWLRLFESRSLFVTGQTKHAERSLKQLDLWLEERPQTPEVDRLRGLVRADRASYAVVRGAVNEGIYFAQNALDNLAEDDHIGRMRAVAILGLAQSRCGDVRSSQELFSQAIDLALEMNLSFGAVPLICNLSEVQIAQGALTDALRSSERALDLGLVDGQPTASSGFARLQIGKVLYERNELAAAEDNLRQALQLLARGGIAESFGSVQAVLAQVRQAQGHPEEALALAQGAVETAKQEGISRLIILALAYQVRIWLAQGATGRAAAWADNYVRLDPVDYLREFEDLTLAKVLLAINQIEEALALLDSLVGSALDASRINSVIQIRLLQTLGADALGKNQAALETLIEAVDLAVPEGYCRVFLDLGAPMARLLQQLAQEGEHQAASIIQSFDFERLASSKKKAGRQEILIEPLSAREVEVLQLLAAGHTNKEIAQILFLSPNTVRSHTYNIYSKLDVHSRTQAAAKARILGLVDPEQPG